MIYEFPAPEVPIRQGDIFRSIPRIDVDLDSLPVFADGDFQRQEWLHVAGQSEPIATLVGMRSVSAIVITQDCDAIRIDDIALCEIEPFDQVESNAKGAAYPKKTVSVITKHSRLNLKWFYLPVDPRMGFEVKMAVDFHSVIRASRTYLQKNMRSLRIGRLNDIAEEHFRERLSDYFRRYAYDEWYALDRLEFAQYKNEKPDPIDPFPWQQ